MILTFPVPSPSISSLAPLVPIGIETLRPYLPLLARTFRIGSNVLVLRQVELVSDSPGPGVSVRTFFEAFVQRLTK